MVKILLLLNSILAFPFGLAALWCPKPVFAGFGVHLDAAGSLIARGYAATLLGYGVALFLLRGTRDVGVSKAVLASLVVWNTVEAVIQGQAGLNGTALPLIFGNVAVHGIMAIVCLGACLRVKPA